MKKSYVYLLTTFMLWGSLYVVSQFVLGKIPTFTVAMFRYLIAFIALSLISLKSEKEKIEKSDYKYFFIMGFIGYFISVDCQLLGTKIAGGSMASLINSLNPVIISVMAMIILNEKSEMNKIVGIVLSLAGVYMIIGTGANIQFLGVVVFHDVLTTSFVLGSAFIIVGVLISLLFKKRTRKEKEVLV